MIADDFPSIKSRMDEIEKEHDRLFAEVIQSDAARKERGERKLWLGWDIYAPAKVV